MNEFEQFWNRNEELLLKFCELLDTDKEGFKINVYDQFKKYGIVSILEEKLQKIYKQTKVMKYLYGNKTVKVIKVSFREKK
jgi:hypothetical protein